MQGAPQRRQDMAVAGVGAAAERSGGDARLVRRRPAAADEGARVVHTDTLTYTHTRARARAAHTHTHTHTTPRA